MKISNLSNLIKDAIEYEEASASSGRWRAYREHCVKGKCNPYGEPYYSVEVWHHNTAMFRVYQDGQVDPLDEGHGSTSDRCGVRKITAGYNGDDNSISWKELYGYETSTKTELKKAVADSAAPHFFSHSSMLWFDSKLEAPIYKRNGGYVFITSERYEDDDRKYTVRSFPSATNTIDTVGEFQQWSTLTSAQAVAEKTPVADVEKIGRYWN
tara:strand:+ start:558 stop:1190 length:633 start_codon:yes stop_codon:yes gene_type:complete